ncbi:MAG: Uncharacterised protein [Cyanobium sp. ARS6]|nr:MAG: Uncharacterised protein [Cyanobium sp. ARS6]
MTLTLTQTLVQFRHHPSGVLIKPFTGPHSIQRESRQHRSRFLGGSWTHCSHQVRTQTADHPIEPLAQAELSMKAAAIELFNQAFKALPAQRAPARLHRQRLTPALNLF